MRSSPRTLALAGALAGSIALAACGGSSTSASTSTTASSALPPVSSGSSGTPTIGATSAPSPSKLIVKDLKVGSGATATSQDTVTVHYVGALYPSAKVFNAWNGPISFSLAQVIPGFEKGIVGMKVGGRRELVIPPALGYGANSPGAGIPPNATLTFVIQLDGLSQG